MKQVYHKNGPCGFCSFFGQSSRVCKECEIRKISEYLEALDHQARWEHDHKYCTDGDGEISNCAHCEYAIMNIDTRYHALEYADEVCCWHDLENLGEGEPIPKRSALSMCGKWKRAADKGR